jgi:hypothetical protein
MRPCGQQLPRRNLGGYTCCVSFPYYHHQLTKSLVVHVVCKLLFFLSSISNIPQSLDAPPTRNLNRLPIHIAKQRTHDRQHTTRRLGRAPRPAKRDILICVRRRALPCTDLRPWNSQRDLLPARCRDVRALLLGRRQARLNVAKCNRVGADAELRTPLFRDRLGHARHARLGNRVINLARIAVRAGGARNLHNTSWLAVLDAEVGRGFAHEAEWRGVVYGEHRVELLVAHLVDHPVPRVAGVVDDDVDLAAAEVGRCFDELREVRRVCHVAGHGDGAVRVCGVDGGGDVVAFFYRVEANVSFGLLSGLGRRMGWVGERTGVDIADDDFGALISKEAGAFGTDALPAAGDDGCLAGEHALGVVEVA